MRYHTECPDRFTTHHGRSYNCNHPLYNRCTLYQRGRVGLAVIQQRFNKITKTTRWTEIDPWLVDIIYNADGFDEYFRKRASPDKDGLYPTVTVRQAMWALRIKPIKRERWETVFDRTDI